MIEIDAKNIQPVIDNLSRFSDQVTSQDILLSLAQKVKDSIYLRTMRNQDIKGKSFKPYSSKYAKKKGVSTGQVNLYGHGDPPRMLESMAVKMLSNDASEVYFQGFKTIGTKKKKTIRTGELASWHNTGEARGGKKREFFGVTNEDLNNLIADYSSYITNVIQEQQLA